MHIKSISQFRRAYRDHKYAWPGGYPTYFITSDGAALSFEAVKDNLYNVLWSIANKCDDGWRIVALDINYEDTELYCGHTGKQIESAYGDD